MILSTAAGLLIGLVIAFHLVAGLAEMLVWPGIAPLLRRFTGDPAEREVALARNMGLYNLFLAGGLILAARIGSGPFLYFLLLWVVVAGLVGWWTAGGRLFLLGQAAPAVLALLALLAAG